MAKFGNPLDQVKVAAPCTADWESMLGDERRRFCGQCEKNVYNLSAMTRREAEELINRTEGRLCVRFYRRADGTVLTQDCPVGLLALKRRLKRVRNAVVSSVLSFLAGIGIYAAAPEPLVEQPRVMGTMVSEPPLQTPPIPLEVTTGKLVFPPEREPVKKVFVKQRSARRPS
ncbi:MAG: hypothetical protein JO360_03070 [Acidobacteria bacterium]|nr:hypothetical protein [Acidobacteriota bacterium]